MWHPLYTRRHTHTSREFDLLTIILIITTGFRLNEADQTRGKVHFLPRTPTATVSGTNVQLTPCSEGLDAVSNDSPLHFLPPLSASLSYPPGHTQKFWKEGETERPLPSRFSRPTVLFSAQVTCSPARLRLFLCPRFSAESDARGGPNRDGISTRVRFGSVLPSGEMSTLARSSAIWGLGDLPGLAPSSPRPLPPPSQLTTGDPSRLQRHLAAAAGTTAGVNVRNVKDLIYATGLISFNVVVELTRFYVFDVSYLFYRVCAVLKLIEKPVFSHLNDTHTNDAWRRSCFS